MPLSSSSMQFSKLDRILKYTAFGSAAVLTLILILATVLEKSLGSGIVLDTFTVRLYLRFSGQSQ